MHPVFVRTKRFWIFLFAATLLAFGVLLPRRSNLIFRNELGVHPNDLALKESLVIASDKSRAEFALLMLRALPEGVSAATYATQLFQQLEIGKGFSGRGVLIVYLEKERLVKIEVSYNLEGVLPDASVRRLEAAASTYFLSDLPQDYFSEALITLSNAIVEGRAPEEGQDVPWLTKLLSGGAGVVSKVASRSPAELLSSIRRAQPAEQAAYSPSDDVSKTVQRYLRSLDNGIGDPGLPLLTRGSQLFRVAVPRNTAQIRRISRDYARAGSSGVIQRGEFALVPFAVRSSTLPIVLRRDEKGLWLVDEVKSWSYFHRFEDSREFFLLTDDNPFREALLERRFPTADCTIYKKRFALPRTSFDEEPSAGPRLGDWYLFELGWLAKAAEAYGTPSDTATRWKRFHVLLNLSRAEEAMEQLKTLYEDSLPQGSDRELHEWYYRYAFSYLRAEMRFSPGGPDLALLKWRYSLLSLQKWWRDLTRFHSIQDRCLRS